MIQQASHPQPLTKTPASSETILIGLMITKHYLLDVLYLKGTSHYLHSTLGKFLVNEIIIQDVWVNSAKPHLHLEQQVTPAASPTGLECSFCVEDSLRPHGPAEKNFLLITYWWDTTQKEILPTAVFNCKAQIGLCFFLFWTIIYKSRNLLIYLYATWWSTCALVVERPARFWKTFCVKRPVDLYYFSCTSTICSLLHLLHFKYEQTA